MNYLRLIFFFCLISLSQLSQAQFQVSEEEVNTQKVFIDATKEKLLGNYENAATLFKEVLKRDKTNHAAAYELARIYDFLDVKDKALQSIKMAIALSPDNQWYQMFLGGLYEDAGKQKDAAKLYTELLKEYPRDAFYYEKLAYVHVKAQNPEKAIKVLDDMEKNFGVHEDISTRKHRIYLGMGNKKKAANELENLIRYAPSNIDYYHMLAGFHEQMGDIEDAKAVYQRILEVDPADVKSSIALAGSTKGNSNDISYLNELKPLFEKDDVNIDLKIKELYPYIDQVANGAASPELTITTIELAELLEATHPREAKSYAALGDLLYYSGDKPGALRKYQKAININKSIFPVWEQVMYIHLEQQNFEELLTVSEDALDRFPNQAMGYYFNGLALGRNAKHRDAVNSLHQALLMSRKNPALQIDIHNHLATEYFQLEQFDKAYQSFDKALKINPNDPMVLNRYSYFLAAKGDDLEKAKSMSALSNELAPNQPRFQDTYGWILYRMKEYKAAKEWINKAISNGGDQLPEVLEHYGDVLFQLKDTEEAISYWQKALEKGSTAPNLEKKITDRKLYE